MKKNLIYVLCVLFLISSLFTACSSDKQVTDSNINDSKTETDKKTDNTNSNFNKTGLPIVNDKVTVRIMVPGPDKDLNEKRLFNEIEEKTNVHVDWEIFPYAQATEKKNLMFASGDYPDAMGGWFLGSNDILTYGPQGVLLKIDEYQDEYCPNLTEAFKGWPEIEKTLTTPDGHIYSLPIAAKQPLTKTVTFINQTWLDKLGLEAPTTTDEFFTVLKAFKDDDPNGNNKQDEIPFSFCYADANCFHRDFFGSFGRVDNNTHKVLEDGKVVFTATQPEYKDAIKYFNKLYSAGLIDQEAITQDGQQYKAKGNQDPIIYGCFSNWDGNDIVGEQRTKDHYVPLLPLKGPNGDRCWNQGDVSIFKTQFAICASTEYPEVMVRWVDQFFDKETSIKVRNGYILNKNSDGTYSKLPVPEGLSRDEFRQNDTFDPFPYIILEETQNSIEKDEDQIWKEKLDKMYEPFIVKEKYPQIWFTPEEQQELSILETDIMKYVDDKQAAWIVGDSSIDAEWDGYINDLNKMGIKKWLEIQQKAIDRY